MENKDYRFETLQLHAGQESPDAETGARAVPIYATTSYVFADAAEAAGRFELTEPGHIYSRLSNPTNDVFERRMAALEGGVGALAVASGMSAIFYAVMNIAKTGDHIVAATNLYGGSINLFSNTLREYGISATFVDHADLAAVDAAITRDTVAVYVETLGNPNSDVCDIASVARVAHAHNIPLIVDNTFATPFCLRPIELGADVVVHSATKFIGGHGTAVGGVVIDGGNFDWGGNEKFASLTAPNESYHGAVFSKLGGRAAYITKMRAVTLRDTGAALSPFHSFLYLQGLETLSLRLERHIQNALRVVEFLENHAEVARVNHPAVADRRDHALYEKLFPNGAGSIFSFEIKGGRAQAARFIKNLRLFSHLANVADAKSLVIHPGSTTHAQMTERELEQSGITGGTIRLSIGIEHIDDILADLDQALNNSL